MQRVHKIRHEIRFLFWRFSGYLRKLEANVIPWKHIWFLNYHNPKSTKARTLISRVLQKGTVTRQCFRTNVSFFSPFFSVATQDPDTISLHRGVILRFHWAGVAVGLCKHSLEECNAKRLSRDTASLTFDFVNVARYRKPGFRWVCYRFSAWENAVKYTLL